MRIGRCNHDRIGDTASRHEKAQRSGSPGNSFVKLLEDASLRHEVYRCVSRTDPRRRFRQDDRRQQDCRTVRYRFFDRVAEAAPFLRERRERT